MANPVEINSLEELRELLQGSHAVVVKFYLDDCAQSQQAKSTFQDLSRSFTSAGEIRFAQVNNALHQDICQVYKVITTPAFLVFRNGEFVSRLGGADLEMVQNLLTTWSKELPKKSKEDEDSTGDGVWNGAEIPRGYGDITEQVEARGCELLNADEGAGPVRVLFDKSGPGALGNGKGSSKDWVQSGSDDQLLLFVPLHSTVKLHTLQNMDFDEAENADAIQSITLTQSDWNDNGTASIGLRFVKFIKTSSLIIFIQSGEEDAESVRIDRVRLIGEAGVMRKMQKLQKVSDE
ncbi:Thioredoxin-like protein 1 [Escovopsis weberi]|uniref:Thioredoxin-like protein 1 n=1 Tax=Escovopsis weberi TaxID=150374 RepID=A0A0M8N6K8_ESCWE|nr:Thioredoxin-like protein 1 [Escovopsis weberi]